MNSTLCPENSCDGLAVRPKRYQISCVWLGILLALVFAVFRAGTLSAQQLNAGGIKGTVMDSSGAAIVGADLAATELTTGVVTTTTSNTAGAYQFFNLPIGYYDLKVTRDGFKSSEVNKIRLDAGYTLTFDISLSVGARSESVTVSATAAQLDTTESSMGTTMTHEEIKDLPLQMGGQPRSALSFLTTLSNVVYNPAGTNGAQNGSFSAASIEGSNGYGNTNEAGYTIDGMDAGYKKFQTVTEFSSILPEAVQELHLASNFNAEQGWDNGTEVALVTKSGTNQYHGSVFYYAQNTVFDAKNYFAAKRSPENQNEFGGAIGGPIRKDKTFFFGAIDFFRYRVVPAGVVASLPTALMRGGNFTEILGPRAGTDDLGRPVFQGEIYDPSTTRQLPDGTFIRDPFDCNGVLNTICPTQFSKLSQFFQAGYPSPTIPNAIQNNWTGSKAPSPFNINKFSFKLDNQFSDRFRGTVGIDAAPTYYQVSGATNFGPLLTTTQFLPQFEYRIRLGFTATLRPNLLYALNVSAAYVGSILNMGDEPAATAGQAAGLRGVFTPNLPVVTIANTTGFGTQYLNYSNPQFTVPTISSFAAWVKGSHTLKFGGDSTQSAIADYDLNSFTAGQFNFKALETGLPNFSKTGAGYASYLIGQVDNGLLSSPLNTRHQGRGWDLYAQDQWRVTSKLTVNYGLRWNASQGPWEHLNSYGAFDPSVPNPAAGGNLGALVFWGTGPGKSGRHYLMKPNYTMFDPRIGVAYSVNSKTVVRAYYGLIDYPGWSALNEGTNAPFYGTVGNATPSSPDNGITPAFQWDAGFPTLPAVPSTNPSLLNGSAVNQIEYNNNQWGRTQSFGLTVERELPWGMTIQGKYVGKLTHGINVPANSIFTTSPALVPVRGWPENQLDPKYLSLGPLLVENINSPDAVAAGIPIPYPGFNGTVAQALLPFPQYSYIGDLNNTSGFSEYNAGTVQLQKRFGNGFAFLVGYTVSKNLLSGFFQANQQDTRKMLATLDTPQNLAISYDYELPFGHGKKVLGDAHGVVEQLVGGWEVTGIHNYFSGLPIAIATNATLPGINLVEVDRNPGVPIRTSTSCGSFHRGGTTPYLNIAAFSDPAPFTLGNTYMLPSTRGCPYLNENISISKYFPIHENIRFKFSATFFNALNRHQFGGLGSNIDSPSAFGNFTTASSPRTIQLSGRLDF